MAKYALPQVILHKQLSWLFGLSGACLSICIQDDLMSQKYHDGHSFLSCSAEVDIFLLLKVDGHI